MFLTRRPPRHVIDDFVRGSQDLPLSYGPVGLVRSPAAGRAVDEVTAAVGTVVAVLIRHLGFWSLNRCRILYTVGDPGDAARFGFAYGALTNHAESGEELFEVFLDPRTDDVMYRIRAMSWAQATLARLGQPIVRALQRRFRDESVRAMELTTRTSDART